MGSCNSAVRRVVSVCLRLDRGPVRHDRSSAQAEKFPRSEGKVFKFSTGKVLHGGQQGGLKWQFPEYQEPETEKEILIS